LGAPRGALAEGLRARIFKSYVSYYIHTSTEVVILRILHGARDHAAIAEEGGFDHRQ